MEAKVDAVKPDVLTAEQQETLRQFKIKTRVDNEKYLSSHPEVEVLVGDFLSEVLLHRPADVRRFAADHFSNPDLHLVIGSKLRRTLGETTRTASRTGPD
ncbi:RIIa domain-containing protein 1 [Neosynchiropus ocellatus]